LRAEGFSCSLDVISRGLRTSTKKKIAIFDPKNIQISFTAVNFFLVFAHQNPGFRTGSGSAIRKNAESGSALNQCESTTLDSKRHRIPDPQQKIKVFLLF
jgi:hypothetical protein